MYGTMIRDILGSDDLRDVAAALEDLCSPHDGYGWSSAAIYGFWDVSTREVLYLGLASDIAVRFAAHAGLRGAKVIGTKQNEVRSHLEANGNLGYTVLPQSPIAQPNVARLRQRLLTPEMTFEEELALLDALDGADTHQIDDLKLLEGKLIRSHADRFGAIPTWNKIEGSAKGAAQANLLSQNTLDAMAGLIPSLLVARRSLRDLTEDHTAEGFEELLHVARAEALQSAFMHNDGVDDSDIVRRLHKIGPNEIYGNRMTYDRLLEARYLDEPEPFLVDATNQDRGQPDPPVL